MMLIPVEEGVEPVAVEHVRIEVDAEEQPPDSVYAFLRRVDAQHRSSLKGDKRYHQTQQSRVAFRKPRTNLREVFAKRREREVLESEHHRHGRLGDDLDEGLQLSPYR